MNLSGSLKKPLGNSWRIKQIKTTTQKKKKKNMKIHALRKTTRQLNIPPLTPLCSWREQRKLHLLSPHTLLGSGSGWCSGWLWRQCSKSVWLKTHDEWLDLQGQFLWMYNCMCMYVCVVSMFVMYVCKGSKSLEQKKLDRQINCSHR